ncbi:phytochrome-2 [Cercophora newfieldiana]|uniref:Phytochrome-2 n=1 Tax=Cercophora newfieldiana TaxID=92897 RepID=A0AA40CP80_9PEZI|nr:phytochrome-2 [Cercophora newfieldiana]
MSQPTPVERVFPIRLSILENSPFLQHASESGASLSLVQVVEEPPGTDSAPEAGPAPPPPAEEPAAENNDGAETPRDVPATPEVTMTDDSGSSHGSDSSDPLLTDRFEYAILDDGSHGVVQGTRRAFTRCEDELIHIPGAVQSYGMLVALKRRAEGVFVPRVVSENSYLICRYEPRDLFGFDSFNQVMPIYQRSLFNAQLRNIRRAFDFKRKEQEPVVFAFSFFDPEGRLIPCWCAAHYRGGDTDLYICEFELQDYSMHPLATPQQTEPPINLVDTLGSDHMDIATVSSLHSKSQPIFTSPDLLSQGIDPDTSSVEIVGVATKIQQQFSEASSVQGLLDAIVGVVRELSGFNRVMVYQFDQDYNGTVVAELMDPKVSQDVYRGLHFPSTDIPPQARQLYMINKVRVLFDRTQQTARLVGRDASAIMEPLDLTHAYLRAMSPVHLKYLANMEVRSSMSMSLESEGKLWGLIVCHSYGPTATRVPFSVRELSYFIGVAASTCLEKLLNADKLQARRIIDTLQDQRNPNECITASSEELLKLFEADCGFLVIEGEARTIGRLCSYTEAVTMLRYLFFRRLTEILFSSNISEDFKDMHYPSGFKSIAGVLYIPLSGVTDDCVIFFRRNQLREVHWAGRPSLLGEFGTLEPRNSFRRWTQVVDGTSKNWTPEQANIAAMAQLVYGSFIRVWREKEAAVKETRLKRLLLHDASHQVRTPLNAVVNYLEMALEKPLEESTKHALATSYAASKSLIYVIDDLLNLTGSTTGSTPLLCDPFDIATCLDEALFPLKRLGGEKGIEVVSRATSNISRYLRGDPSSLQRAIAILVANAIEHSVAGQVVVEWGEISRLPNASTMRIAVTDYGPGLSERELDDMFQVFEQVPDEDFDEVSAQVPARDNVLRVGVGLAFVARYVKQRNGQLKVVSAKDKGSTFAIEVPFLVVSRTPSLAARRDASPLPVLPMPGRPTAASTSTSGINVTPSVSSGVGMSPPIVAPTPKASPMESAVQTPATNHFTVLIADDNKLNVQVLQKRLSMMGHRVLVSRDGQECLNIFVSQQATIDFVLMDLNMPVVDGWASTRMIREQEHKNPTPSHSVLSCGRTPIFAVSGMLRRGDESRYIEAGFDGWMPKPIDMKRLGTYLAGAWDSIARSRGIYDDKHFEFGGWFATQEPTPIIAPNPTEVPLEEYPPLPETPATQGYQIWESAAPLGNPAETVRTPHGVVTAEESSSANVLDEEIASEEIPGVGRRGSRPDGASHPEGGGEVAPETPEWPPIASPWRTE